MNIIPVSSTKSSFAVPSFNGKVIAKGNKWPAELKDIFENSVILNEVASTIDKDICGRLSVSRRGKSTLISHKGDKIYKIKLSLENETPSFLDSVTAFIRKPFNASLTRHYHSEWGITNIIKNEICTEFIKKRLHLN